MSSVDVIVPCYRYGHFLRGCVESVLPQSGVQVRVLIIDDASPDDTAEVAAALARDNPQVSVISHLSNRGHIATYNEGIDWASADYLLLLSADDYLLPGALMRATALMDKYPGVAFAFGDAVILKEDGSTSDERVLTRLLSDQNSAAFTGCEFLELSLATNIVPTPTAVVRTKVQKQVGGYRLELPHSGDMEMWLRLAARGSVGYVRAFQAVYRRHGNNMSESYSARCSLPDVQQRKMALDQFFQYDGRLNPEFNHLRHKVYRALACHAVSYASSAFNEGDTETVDCLLDTAASICADVKLSWPWAKLACKRLVGARAWTTARAIVKAQRDRTRDA